MSLQTGKDGDRYTPGDTVRMKAEIWVMVLETEDGQQAPETRQGTWRGFSPTALRGKQPCWHWNHRCLASRTETKTFPSVIEATQLVLEQAKPTNAVAVLERQGVLPDYVSSPSWDGAWPSKFRRWAVQNSSGCSVQPHRGPQSLLCLTRPEFASLVPSCSPDFSVGESSRPV